MSADTIVPQAAIPQRLNRYSYVGNNPLKYTDPSGHCWGVASGARSLPTYDVTCSNLDMALTIVQHPDASGAERLGAGAYLAAESAAHAAVVVGTGIIAWEAIVPALTAGGTGAAIAEGACGDGDCTNEVTTVATQLGKVGPNSVETAKLADQLARLSTNGSDSRVVLGEYIPGSAGSYEQIAIQRGGIYFQTPNGAYSLLGKFGHSAKDMAWKVNQAFLRQMMERRVAAIDFANMDIDDVLTQYGRSPIPWDQLTGRMRELFYLLHNAEQYGYERIGNSFVLKP